MKNNRNIGRRRMSSQAKARFHHYSQSKLTDLGLQREVRTQPTKLSLGMVLSGTVLVGVFTALFYMCSILYDFEYFRELGLPSGIFLKSFEVAVSRGFLLITAKMLGVKFIVLVYLVFILAIPVNRFIVFLSTLPFFEHLKSILQEMRNRTLLSLKVWRFVKAMFLIVTFYILTVLVLTEALLQGQESGKKAKIEINKVLNGQNTYSDYESILIRFQRQENAHPITGVRAASSEAYWAVYTKDGLKVIPTAKIHSISFLADSTELTLKF